MFALITNYVVSAHASEDVIAKLGEPFLLKAGESARIIDGNHDVVLKLIYFHNNRHGDIGYGLTIQYEMIIDGVIHNNAGKGTWPQGVPYDLFLGDIDYFNVGPYYYFKDQNYMEFAVLDSVKVCEQPGEMNLPRNIKSYVDYLSHNKDTCEKQLRQRFFNFEYCYAPMYSASISQDDCIVNVLDQIKASERCNKVNSLFQSKCIQTLSHLDSSLCSTLKQADIKKACFQKLSEIEGQRK